jgi:hypothetical protein
MGKKKVPKKRHSVKRTFAKAYLCTLWQALQFEAVFKAA